MTRVKYTILQLVIFDKGVIGPGRKKSWRKVKRVNRMVSANACSCDNLNKIMKVMQDNVVTTYKIDAAQELPECHHITGKDNSPAVCNDTQVEHFAGFWIYLAVNKCDCNIQVNAAFTGENPKKILLNQIYKSLFDFLPLGLHSRQTSMIIEKNQKNKKKCMCA